LILFLAALAQCAFVLIPHQPVTALAVQLLISGLGALALLAAIVLPTVRRPSWQPRTWLAARMIASLAASVPVVIAGLALLGALPGGLYWFVAGVMPATLVATANAWVLLVEVVRDERYRPM
jgi:hypothetical protein